MGRGGGLTKSNLQAAALSTSTPLPSKRGQRSTTPVRTTPGLTDLSGLAVGETADALERLTGQQKGKVGEAIVERSKNGWLLHVPGMPPIFSVHAGQAAQQAIGANMRQNPGRPDDLSRVEEGKVRLAQQRFKRFSDDELEQLSDQVQRTSPTGDRKLQARALSRELHERKEQQWQRKWDEERREKQRRWDEMLAEQSPVEERLQAVEAAYEERTRDLNFHRRFDPGEFAEVEQALRAIDSYNNFRARRVIEALEPIKDQLAGIVVGREGSPAIYALLPSGISQEDRDEAGCFFLRAMQEADADELSWPTEDRGHSFDIEKPIVGAQWVRAWWD